MAEPVAEFPNLLGKGYKDIYPWDDWADGRVWCIERDTDFVCLMRTITSSIHKAAHDRGRVAKTMRDGEDRIYFQMTTP